MPDKKPYFVQEVASVPAPVADQPKSRSGGYNAGNQFVIETNKDNGDVDRSRALTKAECTG